MTNHGLIDDRDPQIRREPAVAIATLVAATGSSSKKLGAKMIVGRSGRLLGGVTIGGCVDAQVIEAADALVDGARNESALDARRVLSISLDDDEAWEIGLTCGGTLEVVLDRVDPSAADDPTIAAHRRALQLLAAGEAAMIVTPLEPRGAAYTLSESEFANATFDGRVFVDRLAPPATLVIVGAGQIAMTLTRFARELEMRTVVVDGRERYATAERFPDADDVRVGMPSEIVAELLANAAGGKNVAVILVAHDYKYELPILRNLLRTSVGYVGMLGSKKRGVAVRQLLRDEGFTDDELARIHSPIGLDLGGKSPAEVALSILAEIVAVRNGRRA
jgi:xanthine dehydrogenase accessory factor